MSDAIFITGLLVHAHHGVMRHEKKVGQQFVIDLELAIDLAEAGASDKLVDTVSYASIVEAATRAFTAKSFRLVEAAARSDRRRGARVVPARRLGAGDGAQAARADRRDLQRRRRHHPAQPRRLTAHDPEKWRPVFGKGHARDHGGGADRARRQRGRCARDARPGRRGIVRRGRRPPARPLVRLPHPAVGRRGPAAVHQPLHRGRDLARPARPARPRARGRARVRARPRPASGAGGRARSTSISSPTTR